MRWYRVQAKRNIPDRLWDYGVKWVCETKNILSNRETQDISEYLDFGLYDYVTFRQNAGLGLPEIGRWLGVSHRFGQLMSYWILPESGIPISCSTVQNLTNAEKSTTEWKEKIKSFEERLRNKWDATSADVNNGIPQTEGVENVLSLEDEPNEFKQEFKGVISSKDIPEADDLNDNEYGEYDPYLNMTLSVKHGLEGRVQDAVVKRRATGDDGKPIGIANSNPMLDTRQYEVEYSDGHEEILTANTIAINLLSQVDEEGHRQLLLDEIEDHRILDDAVPIDQGEYLTNEGTRRRKKTTQGWEFYVKWKGGSGDWIKMKDLKDTYPVELSDYAIRNNLQQQPEFAWWLPHVIKKRNVIIKKIKTKYWDKTHK